MSEFDKKLEEIFNITCSPKPCMWNARYRKISLCYKHEKAKNNLKALFQSEMTRIVKESKPESKNPDEWSRRVINVWLDQYESNLTKKLEEIV